MNTSIYNRLYGISGFLSVFAFVFCINLYFCIAAILQIYQIEDLAPELLSRSDWILAKKSVLISSFVQIFCYVYAIYLLFYKPNKKSFHKIVEIIWLAGPVINILLVYIAYKFEYFVVYDWIYGYDIKAIAVSSISTSLFWTAYFYKSKKVYINFFENDNIKLFTSSIINLEKVNLQYLLNKNNTTNNSQKSHDAFHHLENNHSTIKSLNNLKIVKEQHIPSINQTVPRDTNSISVNNFYELGGSEQSSYNNFQNNTKNFKEIINDDEEYYFEATNEWDDGHIDSKLWSKSIAVNNGDELKAKYYYIRSRVEKLKKATESKKEDIERQDKIDKFINNCKNDVVYLRKILNLKNFKVTIGSNNNYYIFDSNGLYKAINGDADLSEFLLEHFVNSREGNS